MKQLNSDLVKELLDHKSESVASANDIKLQQQYGLDNIYQFYIEAFYKIKNFSGRMLIAYWLVRYAREDCDVVKMAIHGLTDRAYIVRSHCCSILAYACKEDTKPYLKALLESSDHRTVEDATAALNAIEQKNHHLWVDRRNTGKSFWKPGK